MTARVATTILSLLVAVSALASDVKTLVGDDPLKSDFNKDKGAVRVIFLGAPT